MTDYRCEGKCGRIVTTDGAYCFECWADSHSIESVLEKIVNHPVPNRRTPAGESLRLRLDVLNLAYHFAFGPQDSRADALDKLSHLTHTLREGLNRKETT